LGKGVVKERKVYEKEPFEKIKSGMKTTIEDNGGIKV
jgi:hypothetical protein